jgi:ubiquinone/menaquinone biosynthesis C-methylase UbiE
MDIKKQLKEIQRVYKSGGNIIATLRTDGSHMNETENVAISYDFQAGSYIRDLETPQNADHNEKYTKALADIINSLVRSESPGGILEVGVGEGTTLGNVIGKLAFRPSHVYGFDISWSRVRFAHEYLKAHDVDTSGIIMADLFNAPFADDSVDIVYTSHSIEPNGGREKEALEELYRITGRYLILLEPAYDLAGKEARERMERHGYVKTILETAHSLGYDVIEHRLFDHSINPLNPTGLTIIKKKNARASSQIPLVCPLTRTPLEFKRDSFFSREALLAYPIVDGVPALVAQYAIIATHFDDF